MDHQSSPRRELNTDPIVAIATATGRGAVGLVRLSGPHLADFAQALCGQVLVPRHAHYLPLREASGEVIDRGLALFFPAPYSYTGEDVLELQIHGGPVVLQLLLARCLSLASSVLPRLRLAQPGEFTQRAFLNDKLDLAQAEAVSDLIDASTEAAARSASRSLSGAFSQRVDALVAEVIQLRMLVESTLDFPEEEIEFIEKAQVRQRLAQLAQHLSEVLAQTQQGALLREGVRVVLAGQPNVGKSSLLNALAGAELAIVTPIAGTTRDKVSQAIQIEGVPLHIIDTAGLREPDEVLDVVEQIGISRSWEAMKEADAVIFLHDAQRFTQAAYQTQERAIAASLQGLSPSLPVLHVLNKCDLAENRPIDASTPIPTPHALAISAKTGDGLDALRKALLHLVGWSSSNAGEGLFIARARHVQALQQAQLHLHAAQQHAEQKDRLLDLLAEELRLVQLALSAITGAFSADDLLGEIFSRFCIGK